MKVIDSNIDKYHNYRQLHSKLNRALKNEFYFEAIFIEYAIVEDRATSLLVRLEKFNPNKHNMISKKLTAINYLVELKKCILSKYITKELIAEIKNWINARNRLIHALPNIEYSDEQIQEIAIEGQRLCKIFSNKVGLHKKFLLRKQRTDNYRVH